MLCKLQDRKSLNSPLGCIQLTYTKSIDMLNKSTHYHYYFFLVSIFRKHVLAIRVALIKYLKPAKNCLPDPKESLARLVPS